MSGLGARSQSLFTHLVQGMKLNFDQGVGVGGETVMPWVLTIYIGKQKIRVGKSNGLRHCFWEPSENMGCDLRQCNFSTLFSLLSLFGYTLYWIVFPHCQFYSFMFMQKISIQVVCVDVKHPIFMPFAS